MTHLLGGLANKLIAQVEAVLTLLEDVRLKFSSWDECLVMNFPTIFVFSIFAVLLFPPLAKSQDLRELEVSWTYTSPSGDGSSMICATHYGTQADTIYLIDATYSTETRTDCSMFITLLSSRGEMLRRVEIKGRERQEIVVPNPVKALFVCGNGNLIAIGAILSNVNEVLIFGEDGSRLHRIKGGQIGLSGIMGGIPFGTDKAIVYGINDSDPCATCIDSDGNAIWTQSYEMSKTRFEKPISMIGSAVTFDGKMLFAVTTREPNKFGVGPADITLIRVDSLSGKELSRRQIQGASPRLSISNDNVVLLYDKSETLIAQDQVVCMDWLLADQWSFSEKLSDFSYPLSFVNSGAGGDLIVGGRRGERLNLKHLGPKGFAKFSTAADLELGIGVDNAFLLPNGILVGTSIQAHGVKGSINRGVVILGIARD